MPTQTINTTPEQTPIPDTSDTSSTSPAPSPFEKLPPHLVHAIDEAYEAAPSDRFNVAYALLRGRGYSDTVRRHLAGKVAAIASVLAEGEEEPPQA